ncbi:MAG: aspartate carbamoyltransferase catalytic subunit [Tatlockia sp.]|jgi:aspartate carbamoyltransferase catalytic subunit
MKHFLEISQLTTSQIHALLARALEFKKGTQYPVYSKHTLANLFYENSTRTRVSFEIAAKQLSLSVINLEMQHSSESKGETLTDTIKTLGVMGINVFVLRHKQDNLPNWLAEQLGNNPAHLINAGDGQHAHPSQAMLDMMTILEKKPDLSQLKIAILGNIRHSRVANSMQCLCAKLQVGELVLIAPEIWQPQKVHYGRVTSSLQEGLAGADVVICLRVQYERLLQNETIDLPTYLRDYTLTTETLRFAKPDAMIMHPGPINREVEISSAVADGPQSFILQQVSNGVFMRMAILDALLNPSSKIES